MPTYNMTYPVPVTASGAPAFDTVGACDTDDLWMLADQILNRVVAIYGACGITLPDRRYIAVATPAQDCEQVTVAWQQSYIGPPGDEASMPQRCEAPRSAVFQVVITRCIPVVDDRNRIPSAEALSQSARVLMQDGWLLLQSVDKMDDYMGVIATVEGGEAQGGLQSAVLTLTLGVP